MVEDVRGAHNTSLAFDSLDNPGISYLDASNWNWKHLKFARDRNGDGDFNTEAFTPIAKNWQNACQAPTWCDGADLNISGTIEITDLQTLAASWLD